MSKLHSWADLGTIFPFLVLVKKSEDRDHLGLKHQKSSVELSGVDLTQSFQRLTAVHSGWGAAQGWSACLAHLRPRHPLPAPKEKTKKPKKQTNKKTQFISPISYGTILTTFFLKILVLWYLGSQTEFSPRFWGKRPPSCYVRAKEDGDHPVGHGMRSSQTETILPNASACEPNCSLTKAFGNRGTAEDVALSACDAGVRRAPPRAALPAAAVPGAGHREGAALPLRSACPPPHVYLGREPPSSPSILVCRVEPMDVSRLLLLMKLDINSTGVTLSRKSGYSASTAARRPRPSPLSHTREQAPQESAQEAPGAGRSLGLCEAEAGGQVCSRPAWAT